jgi:hypothetical protein
MGEDVFYNILHILSDTDTIFLALVAPFELGVGDFACIPTFVGPEIVKYVWNYIIVYQ